MSTNTFEAKELLRLFKCIIDTGTEVLAAFGKCKLLPPYNGNFEKFLDDKKHAIFHLWQSQKLPCCECATAGCNLQKMGHMGNWIFNKIYNHNGHEDSRHVVRNSGKIIQMCLHKYVTRNIKIDELDIIAISFLLRNLGTVSQTETNALDLITTLRSQICHAYSMNCFSMSLLNASWADLEKALVNLTEPSYKQIIRKQITYLRKADLEETEITKLARNVQEVNVVIQELKTFCNNNFKGMESRLERISIKNTKDIKEHTSAETCFFANQTQQAISDTLQETNKKIENETRDVQEAQFISFEKLGNQLHETRSEIYRVQEYQEKNQGEILREIQNLKLRVKYEMPSNLFVPEETYPGTMECPVIWQIATPEHWNLEEVEATLQKKSSKDEQFKIKFVRKGSLIMLTTIAASILRNAESFETAVMSFLTKMIEDCDIDTKIPCRVDVTLHILNRNEVSICCELSHPVPQKATSGIKKHTDESKIFDVAFFNGDDDKEIEWVQNISSMLEIKFDIKCAILSDGYMHGFPVKGRLRQKFNLFQAIILTLTEKNYRQYDDYIEDDMSVIAVELEYIEEIRPNLRKYPYISCTTCEHLWFPRLIDTLKSKLPASTAVYQNIGLTQAFYEMHFILCGSLSDEAWIMNFLHQIGSFEESYMISSWKRSIKTHFRITENIHNVFVLVSPNLRKCKLIDNYIYSLSGDKNVTIQWIQIGQKDQTSSSQLEDINPNLDGSIWNHRNLAGYIFTTAKKRDTRRPLSYYPKDSYSRKMEATQDRDTSVLKTRFRSNQSRRIISKHEENTLAKGEYDKTNETGTK